MSPNCIGWYISRTFVELGLGRHGHLVCEVSQSSIVCVAGSPILPLSDSRENSDMRMMIAVVLGALAFPTDKENEEGFYCDDDDDDNDDDDNDDDVDDDEMI